MPNIFVIADDFHGEELGEFGSIDAAWAELEHLATVPWNEPPNVTPCSSWQTCSRSYEIVELSVSSDVRQEIKRVSGFEISSEGVVWSKEAPHHGA